MSSWVRNLKQDIEKRFRFVLDINDPDFKIVYALATFIDLTAVHVLRKKQGKKYYDKVLDYLRNLYCTTGKDIKQKSEKSVTIDEYGELSSDDDGITEFSEYEM